ncbi:MAG: hypothetical protein K1W17_13565 [Oscillospiraceae bacterium]
MGFKITLENGFSGEHMGLVFTQGTAHTADAFLASRLKSKGYGVASDEVISGEAVHAPGEAAEAHVTAAEAGKISLEEMTVSLLRERAAEKGVDLGGARTKAEIIAAIYATEADSEVS